RAPGTRAALTGSGGSRTSRYAAGETALARSRGQDETMNQTGPGGSRSGDNIGRGILFTVISVVVFGIQDATDKVLVQTYPPFQIAMMRYWAFAAFSLILVAQQAPIRLAFRSRAPLTQIARGLLLIGDVWFFAYAVRTIPLGELQAIVLIYPLLVTLLAIPIL